MSARDSMRRCLNAFNGEEFTSDEFPTLEDGKAATAEYAALLDIAEAALLVLRGTAGDGTVGILSAALARLDAIRAAA